MIELYVLEHLVTFYEEGSISKAAEKLFISQSAVTRSMQKLETELGIKIFVRTGNKVTFNENGKTIYEYAKSILDMENILLAKANEIKEQDNIIRVGMTAPGILYQYAEKFLLGDQNKYQTKIDTEENLYRGLDLNIYDVIFVNNTPKYNLPYKFIVKEKLYLGVPKTHFLAGLEKVSYKEADGQSFLISNNLGPWNDIVKKHLPNSRLLVQDMHQLTEVAESSTIPSFATNITLKIRIDEKRVFIPFVGEDTSLDFYIVSKKKDLINHF